MSSQHPDQETVEALIRALYANTNETEDWELRSTAASLIKYGKVAVQPLVHLLQDKQVSSLIKRYASWILWHIPDERAVDPLLTLLSDRDDLLVEGAMNALSRIGNHTATERIVNILLTSPSENLRSAAASALGLIRNERAIDGLITGVKTDASERVRRMAASALGYYRGEKVVQALICTLYDEEIGVPRWAKDSLLEQGEAAQPHLKKIFDENPKIIKKAFNTWSWEWIEASRTGKHRDLEVSFAEGLGGEIESADIGIIQEDYKARSHSCPLCGRAANQLAWFFFSTPPETWEVLVGRAGWMTVCDKCHIQVDFFGGIMS
jgi:HEAT repeat protein